MIFYVTNNIERAAGIDLDVYPDVFLVSNKSPLSDYILENNPNIKDRIILNEEGYLSSLDLLKKYSSLISEKRSKEVKILVFKNSLQIERFCKEQGWELSNPKAELVNKFERKISQFEWLNQLVANSYKLPETLVGKLGEFNYEDLASKLGNQFIIQYNTGHTGASTKLFSNSRELENTIEKFPKREVRIAKFIKGQVYTINACVCGDTIKLGQVSLQITGDPELTNNSLATVGNDWSVVKDNLSSDKIEKINNATIEIGKQMQKDGWQGLCGVDFVVEEGLGEIYLIEINARQAASVSYETELAHKQDVLGPMDWQLSVLANLQQDQYYDKDYSIDAWQKILRIKHGPVYDEYGTIDKVKNIENKKIIPGIENSGEILRIQK